MDGNGWDILIRGLRRIGVFQPKSDHNRLMSTPRSCLGDATWWPRWLGDVDNQHLSNFPLHCSFGRVLGWREASHMTAIRKTRFSFFLPSPSLSCSFSTPPTTLITFFVAYFLEQDSVSSLRI
jgi:hypothetical protein